MLASFFFSLLVLLGSFWFLWMRVDYLAYLATIFGGIVRNIGGFSRASCSLIRNPKIFRSNFPSSSGQMPFAAESHIPLEALSSLPMMLSSKTRHN